MLGDQDRFDPEQMRRQALMGQLGQKAPGAMPAPNATFTPGPNRPMTDGASSVAPPVNPGMPNGVSPGTPPMEAPTRRVTGGNLGSVQGYDAAKFADPNVQSLKYRAGRILSDYPQTSAGIQQAIQDPRWQNDPDLAKATYDGRDVINFMGALSDGESGVPVNGVDVLQAFDNGGSSQPFQWIDIDAAGREQGGTPSGGGGGATMTMSNIDQLGNSDILAQIMQQIQGLAQGQDPLQREAIMQLLGGRQEVR